MIGLTGAHRTGKTLLAQKFAEANREFVFVQTSASGVFKDMGLDPAVEYPFDVRLDVQERILFAFREQYRSMNGKQFITDRTPIDLIAYTLSEARQGNITDEQYKRLDNYMQDCFKLTNETFGMLVIVQPGIEVVPAKGKASLSQAYIEHIAYLVMGVTACEGIKTAHYYIPRHMTDIDKRVKCIESCMRRTVEKHQNVLDTEKEKGAVIIH